MLLERELKSLLTKEEYHHLIRHPLLLQTETSSHIQLNYYYDTVDYSLQKQDVTIRVRQTDECLWLEIKKPVEETRGYKVKQEWRYSLDRLPSFIDLDHHFPALEGQRALLTFPLLTERKSCRVHEHIRIDLDKSMYVGNMDYEIEIEFSEGKEREAEEWFYQLLPGKRLQKADGKKTRFFQALIHTIQEGKGLSLNGVDFHG